MCAANCACSKRVRLVVMPRQKSLGDGYQLPPPPTILPSQITGLTQDQITPLLPTFIQSLPGGSKDNPIQIAPAPNSIAGILQSLFTPKTQPAGSTSQSSSSWWQSSDLISGYTNGQIVEYALLGVGALGLVVALLRSRRR